MPQWRPRFLPVDDPSGILTPPNGCGIAFAWKPKFQEISKKESSAGDKRLKPFKILTGEWSPTLPTSYSPDTDQERMDCCWLIFALGDNLLAYSKHSRTHPCYLSLTTKKLKPARKICSKTLKSEAFAMVQPHAQPQWWYLAFRQSDINI